MKKIQNIMGYKWSKEQKEKHSKIMRNWHKSNKHPMDGKTHNKESKNKMSESHIGKEVWNTGTKGIMKPNKTSFKSGEGNNNFGKDWSNQKGKNHWNWKGGITPEMMKLRNSFIYKMWRGAVFFRDNFTCQNENCEFCENKPGAYLHAHHIKAFAKFPELRFNIPNGITYCRNYHAVLESKIRRGTNLIISG